MTGFDFREKNRVFLGLIGGRVCFQSPTLPLYCEGKVMNVISRDLIYDLIYATRHFVVVVVHVYMPPAMLDVPIYFRTFRSVTVILQSA